MSNLSLDCFVFLSVLLGMIFDADATLASLQEQLEELTAQRDGIERQIAGVKQSIYGILMFKKQTFGGRPISPVATTSLTDACRDLLRAIGVPLAPVKVKEGLELGGYDFSAYRSNPLTSIHTVLKRLVASGETRVFRDGGVAYQWNPQRQPK